MSITSSILCTGHIEISDEIRAATNGIAIDVVPYIEVYAIKDEITVAKIQELSRTKCVVVFTSFNAVTAVAQCMEEVPTDWTIYCLSGKTRDVVVQHFGEQHIKGTAADSAILAGILVEDGIKEGIFFCGNIRMDTLPLLLKDAGIQMTEVIVYFTDTQTAVVNHDYPAILFFSPSGVRGFFLQNKPGPDSIMYAIGHTTAAEISKYCSNKVVVAPTPSKEKMVLMAADALREKI